MIPAARRAAQRYHRQPAGRQVRQRNRSCPGAARPQSDADQTRGARRRRARTFAAASSRTGRARPGAEQVPGERTVLARRVLQGEQQAVVAAVAVVQSSRWLPTAAAEEEALRLGHSCCRRRFRLLAPSPIFDHKAQHSGDRSRVASSSLLQRGQIFALKPKRQLPRFIHTNLNVCGVNYEVSGFTATHLPTSRSPPARQAEGDDREYDHRHD
jgi:hypothetical protein